MQWGKITLLNVQNVGQATQMVENALKRGKTIKVRLSGGNVMIVAVFTMKANFIAGKKITWDG
jgi:hypothetical protein